MTTNNPSKFKLLAAAAGAAGLAVLGGTAIYTGVATASTGGFESKGGGSGPSYVAPHVPGMQMGQTAGEEPTAVTTSTAPARQ